MRALALSVFAVRVFCTLKADYFAHVRVVEIIEPVVINLLHAASSAREVHRSHYIACGGS